MRRNLFTRATLAVAAALLLITLPRAGHAACVGDCNGDGSVTVDELLLMVNAAIIPNLALCTAGDADGSGDITINEIIQAVNYALTTCPAPPTPTSTPTPSTPTPTFIPGTCGDPAVRATEPLCALDDQTVTCDF